MIDFSPLNTLLEKVGRSMKFSQFFEQVYVPTYMTEDAVSTIKCYRTSVKKLKEHCGNPTIHEVNLHGAEFVRKLQEEGLNNTTIAKHCRHLNSIFSKLGPQAHRNSKKLLDYAPYFQPPKVEENNTTLKHYCQPEIRELVDKMTVPIPGAETATPTPTPEPAAESEPPLHVRIAPAFQFNSKNEIIQFYLKEIKRAEECTFAAKTSSGTILTLYEEKEEKTDDNKTVEYQVSE
jgi:hypothetical protein